MYYIIFEHYIEAKFFYFCRKLLIKLVLYILIFEYSNFIAFNKK